MTTQDPPPGGDDQNRPDDDLPPDRPPSEMGPPLPPPPPDAVPPSTGGAAPPPGGVPPMGGYGAPPPGAQPPPPGGPSTSPDIGAGFSWAWAKFQANAAPLVISTLIIGALAAAAYLIIYIPLLALAGGGGGGGEIRVDPVTGEITGGVFDPGAGFLVTTLVTALALFALFIVIQGIGSNIARMGLKIADGETVTVGDLFTFPRGSTTFVTAFLLALGTAVGYVLCFLPGIAFAWGAAFTFLFFYDRNLAPVDAIKASFTLFKENLGPALLTVLLGGLVASAGALLCLVGIIVSAPVAQLFIVHQYRSMTGGQVAA